MELITNFLILIGACILIFKATELFVHGAVDLAAELRLPKVFIGVALISFVTTAPETIVSVTSSYLGESGMAVGNALGSCICNIGLAFSVGILIKEVVVHKKDFSHKLAYLVGVIFIVFIMISDGTISRMEGGILLLLFILFLFINFRLALKGRESIPEMPEPDKKKDRMRKGVTYFLLGGIATVLLARYGLVYTGLNIAKELHLPPIMIGLSLIALGTSLPELFTAIVASKKNHSEIALGTIIGANIFNLLLVLGASALVRPLTIDTQTLQFNMPMMAGITAIMVLLGIKDLRYSKKEGLVLLSFYLIYLTLLFTFIY